MQQNKTAEKWNNWWGVIGHFDNQETFTLLKEQMYAEQYVRVLAS